MGLVALRHVGSSQTRGRTHVPYIGRRILNHCATREVPLSGTLYNQWYLWFSEYIQECTCGASLVVQWLRIRLLMQGTQVRALVREDPTCHGATKPVRHNY